VTESRPARTDTSAAATQWPDPATPVLARRQLNPATDPATLSVFADDQWNLTPGLFEAHATTTRLNLRSVPEPFRDPVKHYLWQVINRALSRRQRGQLHSQLALSTLPLVLPRLTAFALWLQGHHVGSFGVVTEQHLDSYLIDVTNSETSSERKAELLIEVRRLWSYRERLPAAMRLPTDPPWGGDRPRDLLGMRVRSGVNRTPRIHTDTIDLLLLWAHTPRAGQSRRPRTTIRHGPQSPWSRPARLIVNSTPSGPTGPDGHPRQARRTRAFLH
jgi:hypothetical protein